MSPFKIMPRLLAGCGLLAALILTTACAGNTTTSTAAINTAAPVQQAQQLPTPAPTNRPMNTAGAFVVARVNGIDIVQTDFDRAVQRYQQQQIAAADPAAMQAAVLDTMIEQVLIEQAAAEQQIVVTDEEVETEFQASAALAGSPEAWQTWLTNNLYTEAEFRGVLRQALITGRMRDFITQDLTANVPQVHARHILVADAALAQQLLTRLQAGEDFAVLAAQYSSDITTRENGGDLGWFTREELLEPTLADIAFTAELGQIAGPIQTALGYHLIQPLEREARPVPEDKRAALAQARFEAWLETLTASADIEIYL